MTNQFLSSTKSLGLVLQFFRSSLALPLFIFGLAWLVLIVTTAMAWVVPHSENFVQKWWFYGSVHLVLAMALMLALLTKNLTQSSNMQWVPGWRRAHLQGLVVCLAPLVAVTFAVGAIWTGLAAEPWDRALLPWLIFTVGAAVCCAFMAPFKQADFTQIYVLVAVIAAIETFIVLSQSSKNFSMVWDVWSVLRDLPWLMALGAVLSAWVLCSQKPSHVSHKTHLPIWTTINNALAVAPKLPHRWLWGRRWPLLKISMFSGNETSMWFVVFPQLPAIINSGIPIQILFYWFYLVVLCLTMGTDIKLAKPASMLMLLPQGFDRQTLGRDMFNRLLSKHVTLLFLYTLALVAVLFTADKPLRFLLEPSVIILALGYAIFSAGWIAAFSRNSFNKIVRVVILALPSVASFGLFMKAIFGLTGPHLIAEQTQFGLALIFALTGLYLGRRHTAHWDLQDFNNLLRTSKPLA